MLKTYSFLDLVDVVDWLKVDRKQAGVEGDTKASKDIQDIKYTSLLYGTEGNEIVIEYITGAEAGKEVVTVTKKKISVQIEDGVSTASQIREAVTASFLAGKLVSTSITGIASTPQVVFAAVNLVSGVFHLTYKPGIKSVLESLINAACSWAETEIGGPVLTREFSERHDMGRGNVIIPHYYPVTEITELKIDYSRTFTGAAFDDGHFIIRGGADKRQVSGSVELKVIGTDIVLFDDGATTNLGRAATESAASISLKYKAGWGEDADDLPEDIITATKQLVEYWWLQRENRDINVSAKGVRGESYSKMRDGVPVSIKEILEPYADTSMGSRPLMQKNI